MGLVYMLLRIVFAPHKRNANNMNRIKKKMLLNLTIVLYPVCIYNFSGTDTNDKNNKIKYQDKFCISSIRDLRKHMCFKELWKINKIKQI